MSKTANKLLQATSETTTAAAADVKTFRPDWGAIDPKASDEMSLSLSPIFWKHGSSKLKSLGASDVNFTGGLFASTDAIGEETAIPGWVPASFEGEGGKTVEGLASNLAHITAVRTRQRWFRDDQNGLEFRPWDKYEKNAGFRGHWQIIGFIRGYEFPVCFSFKGLACSFIRDILRELNNKVLSVANRNAPQGRKLPQYAFHLTIEPGKHEKVGSGQQSEATMPRIVLPKVIDEAYLAETYVGNDLFKVSQDLWMEAEKWAHEWDSFEKEASGAAVTAQQLAVNAQAPLSDKRALDEMPF